MYVCMCIDIDHSLRNHYILNLRTINSCKCNGQKLLKITTGNYILKNFQGSHRGGEQTSKNMDRENRETNLQILEATV